MADGAAESARNARTDRVPEVTTMAEIHLTQAEADALLDMPKLKENETEWDYPHTGGKIIIPLVSQDKRERFLLDVEKGRIDLEKQKLQNRARQVVILARLEVNGPTHRNPDDEEIPCPHIHLYREGYDIKWAYPVPDDRFRFSNLTNEWTTLQEFMSYCNIVDPPTIKRGLFL